LTGRTPTVFVGGDALFGAGLSVLLVYAGYLGRGLTFFSDEWPIIAFHYDGRYLVPYDSHLLLLPIGIYRSLFVTAGLATYTPYRIVGLTCYAAFGVMYYLYLRHRTHPLLAALAALAVVGYSEAALNVLFPLALNFSVPLAAMAAIWYLLDLDQARFDVAAGACLAVALASGGVGLVPIVAVGVELLILRAPPRRWLPFALPSALWLVWYVKYHTPITHPNTVVGSMRYAIHQAQATLAGFLGGWNAGGYVLLVASALLLVVALSRWHSFNARAAGALAGAASFAVLTGYTARHGSLPPLPANTSRYLFVDAFFIVAALVELTRNFRPSRAALVASAVVVIIGAATLVGNMRSYNEQVLQYKHTTRTFMVAAEAIPAKINRRRIMPFSLNVVTAGEYLNAVRHLGSAVRGVTLEDLGTASERATADAWMMQDLGLHVVELAGPVPATCGPPTVSGDLEVPRGASLLVRSGSSPAAVALRRLAFSFRAPLTTLRPDSMGVLRMPVDHSALPWHVRVTGAGGSVSVCR
jgi:hypothetical protein